MRILCIIFALISVAPVARAQGTDGPDATAALLEGLVARTPGALLARVSDQPDRFLREAAGLILGYGRDGRIDPAGIEDAIATERANLRARDVRRLLMADLDDDLNVDGRELDVAIAAASATMRGRLMGWHMDADLDRDGTVAWAELRAFAKASSLSALDEEAAGAMRAVMVFDMDGDGFVSVPEVRQALELLGAPA